MVSLPKVMITFAIVLSTILFWATSNVCRYNFAIEKKDTWLTYNLYRYNFDKISNDGRFKDINNIINLPAKP